MAKKSKRKRRNEKTEPKATNSSEETKKNSVDIMQPESNQTDSFRVFWENLHTYLALINLMDMHLTYIGPETLDRWNKSTDDPEKVTLMLGFPKDGQLKERDDLLGTVMMNFKDYDIHRKDLMLNHCNSTIITIHTLIEVYIKQIIREVFNKAPILLKFVREKDVKIPYSILLNDEERSLMNDN